MNYFTLLKNKNQDDIETFDLIISSENSDNDNIIYNDIDIIDNAEVNTDTDTNTDNDFSFNDNVSNVDNDNNIINNDIDMIDNVEFDKDAEDNIGNCEGNMLPKGGIQ